MTNSDREVARLAGSIEDRMYRSSLRQVVAFLNTTLPQLQDSEAASKSKRTGKKAKEKQDEDGELGSYLIKDVTPTRVPKTSSESKAAKKRVNAFSERKYNDIKEGRKLHQKEKSAPKKEKRP